MIEVREIALEEFSEVIKTYKIVETSELPNLMINRVSDGVNEIVLIQGHSTFLKITA